MAEKYKLEHATNETPPPYAPPRNSKKLKTIVLIVLASCLVAGGVFYALRTYESKKAQEASQRRTEFETTISSADQLIAIQDNGGAIKLLEGYAPKAIKPEQVYAVSSRLGNVYFYQSDWNKSISWFERAQQTGQPGSENTALYIARAAEKVGDKEKAIAGYRKVLDRLRGQSGESTQMQIGQYEAKIKALGG